MIDTCSFGTLSIMSVLIVAAFTGFGIGVWYRGKAAACWRVPVKP